ncbi:hypothetical protein PspLS_08421 [Pyricularia sp. CBS 133598]|nr:hypothetical protein PspLS_08421 [Pyricularia sp. CBS 133598]
MFNALNRFISRLDGDVPQKDNGTHGQFGFQVLRNNNLELKIEPWFDFVVGINGRMLDNPDPRLFAQEVRNCAGGTVTLGLWSAKGQRTRALQIPVPVDAPSLGLTLQWTPLSAVSNIWHVLDVPANSPADQAGLLPYSDYILGSPDGVLHGEGGLGELVEDHIGRPLRVWVYNNEYDVTRELSIQPSRDWGGQGALGCVLGYGALHRLPAPLSEPVNAPGETMFDGGEQYGAPLVSDGANIFVPGGDGSMPPPQQQSPYEGGGEFLVPAQLAAPAATTTTSAPPRGKKKDRHHGAGGGKGMMDDYFKEQEAKSKALDNAPSGRVTPVAPPPRAGGSGPPKAGEAAAPPPPPAAKADAAEGEDAG